MAIRVAINGFGRIGRAFARLSHNRGIELVAVNDLGSLENLAYLLKYDTVYGRAPFSVEAKNGALVIDGKEVKFVSEKDPTLLPWKELGIDVVVESTGFFTDYEKAQAHIVAGARRVARSRRLQRLHGLLRRLSGTAGDPSGIEGYRRHAAIDSGSQLHQLRSLHRCLLEGCICLRHPFQPYRRTRSRRPASGAKVINVQSCLGSPS